MASFGLGLSRKRCRWQIAPFVTGQPEQEPGSPKAPKPEQNSAPHAGFPTHTGLGPLTGTVFLCSGKEHLWDDKPPFSREDGVDHPSDCGISLDLRVPHPSHRCASLLEVSKLGDT